MTGRREVRVTGEFFDELDHQLGSERGKAGEPSATDFIVMDLPSVVEQFAAGFDDLPEAIDGVPAMRIFVGVGALVRAFVVHGVETADGVVHLVGIELDV